MDVNEEPSTSTEEVGWASGLSIADQVKAAAEEAQAQSGFEYHEETGLYYDSTTQMYYNSETGLYYNGFTGTWYQYDEAICEYVVHHQVEGFTFENAVAEHVLQSIDNYTSELSKKVEAEIKATKPEGELSEEEVDDTDSKHKKSKCEAHKLAEKLPPCARFLVVSSCIDRVSIHIVCLFFIYYYSTIQYLIVHFNFSRCKLVPYLLYLTLVGLLEGYQNVKFTWMMLMLARNMPNLATIRMKNRSQSLTWEVETVLSFIW